jgi:NNP family nitrate/nitrite transporter-like MFS transporter
VAEVSASASFRSGATNINTWLLFIQYAACFGVELTMNNAAALYFKGTFELTTESAAAIASLFGWMNLFARGLGGFCSDKANANSGMRGRLWFQAVCLVGEGLMVFIFANTASLGLAITIMVIFSCFVQAAEGSTFGIVPYVNPPCTGSISGIVGAGGNTG